MNPRKSVILVELETELDSNTAPFLLSQGYTVHNVRSISELLTLLEKAVDPVIVYQFGVFKRAEEHLRSATKFSILSKHPALLVGPNIKPLLSKAEEFFSTFILADSPIPRGNLVKTIDQLALMAAEKRKFENDILPIGDTTKTASLRAHEAGPQSQTAIITVPQLCFTEIATLNISQHRFGVADFIKSSKPEAIKDTAYLPTDPRVQELVSSLCDHAGRRGASHLHRTSYLSHQMLNVMRITPDLAEPAKNASFLYAWCLVDQPQLLTEDYLGEGKDQTRKEISDRMTSAAQRIVNELDMPHENAIVLTAAQYVGMESQVGSGPVSMISSALMAADLTDRICWQTGVWNPRAVHQILRRLKAADVPDIHPTVLGCMLKFLSQGVEGHGKNLLIAQQIARNPKLKELLDSITATKINDGHREVRLSELTPGMRLAQSLNSFDGQVLVPKDVILDEDLIWRVWQLASIRPMGAIVISAL